MIPLDARTCATTCTAEVIEPLDNLCIEISLSNGIHIAQLVIASLTGWENVKWNFRGFSSMKKREETGEKEEKKVGQEQCNDLGGVPFIA